MHDNSALRSLVCDVLVIGSGAGGLSTAVTAAYHGLEVIVAEKEAVVGGTTAWSGGWMWIPRNPLAIRAGIVEDENLPRQYLQSELGNRSGDQRIDTFLSNGPAMVSFFEENTEVQFIAGNTIPDMHDTPGHGLGGRSVAPQPYDGRNLGPWLHKLRKPLDVISIGGMAIGSGQDFGHFMNAARSARSALYVSKRTLRYALDVARHQRGTQLFNGNALVARLLKSALDLGVEIMLDTRAMQLVREDGRVAGAIFDGKEGRAKVLARKGVVLATGGFPHDQVRISKLFDHAPTGAEHYSAAPPTNVGDGLNLAEALGGKVATDIDNPAAWCPVSRVPRATDTAPGWFPHFVDRNKPGFLAVDHTGRRFVDEAESYHLFVAAWLRATPAGREPVAWLICDHPAQRRYGLGWAKPFPFPIAPYLRNGYIKMGRTVGELADACDLDSVILEQTVTKFNEDALTGTDREFHRGESAFGRFTGQLGHTPNPSLGPLEKGPFYAVRLWPGSLGTFAGMLTDTSARVLDVAGEPIPGLYAVGNDMASIFGGNYPAGGITLGPAMTFGYIIGRVLAGQSVEAAPASITSQA